MRTITIFDANGSVLKTAEAKSKARRFSTRCHADQRQLDAMYEPAAKTATIGTAPFEFGADGKSRSTFVF
jgi:hypothetical protein